ncbi:MULTISPECIES: DUF1997 domain-containing protein [Prochlorococcus]|nr:MULTISPECIES: DUF1997 domain-containing protein [Prochlorococcus]KGG10801.1 Nucleoside-diphosphate-sugar pyrophosphorylase involved in lipopolysaccharide biosynthesis/translation initiation factor 2B [Prochlorococcus marinus str. LG]KGG20149.1 Nucleoside-diphosphate-sugar pyrophosphorylase involved in lipopolysaccharide biosynthesis/translation initiation factor 2B [Prochlorococcus marinus str. SS2]KGG24049.1 Nucleoside-diphosphate-sugar pyrophosphorylase involved in lipopolysaccharide biosyn
MSLAFNARQKIDLPVKTHIQRLPDYLLQQERVVGAMLDPKKLVSLGKGNFRYTVTSFKVFQLEVNPVVSIAVVNSEGRKLHMHATDSELDGLGIVDDFELMLDATLIATDTGLVGEAFLGVSVSQPPLLRLIPPKILESTGHSILNGILLGIKARVGQQLIQDFSSWCSEE